MVNPSCSEFAVRTKTTEQADKMLDSAAQLFGTQRFHEVRMEDIATEAGVGKGTLYRYFNDKEELYLALLRRSSTQFVHQLQETVAQAVDARTKLTALVTAVLDFFDTQPHLLDLIQRAEVMLGSGADVPWQRTRTDLLRLVHDLFAQGAVEHQFAIRDPELAALMLLGSLRSLIRFGSHPRPTNLANQVIEIFLRGAGCPPPPGYDQSNGSNHS